MRHLVHGIIYNGGKSVCIPAAAAIMNWLGN